jgi:hypothetical protein
MLPWKKKEDESGLMTLQRQMNRLFEDFFGRGLSMEPFGRETWAVALDVSETGNSVIVKAEIPGVDPKDVDISISEGVKKLPFACGRFSPAGILAVETPRWGVSTYRLPADSISSRVLW